MSLLSSGMEVRTFLQTSNVNPGTGRLLQLLLELLDVWKLLVHLSEFGLLLPTLTARTGALRDAADASKLRRSC